MKHREALAPDVILKTITEKIMRFKNNCEPDRVSSVFDTPEYLQMPYQ